MISVYGCTAAEMDECVRCDAMMRYRAHARLRAYRASRARIGPCIDMCEHALRQEGGAAQPSSRLWRFQSSLLCAAQQ